MTYNVFSGTLNPTHSLTHVTAHQETWTSIRRRMRGCLDTVSGTSMTDVTRPLLDVLTRCHLLAALHTQTGYQHFCSTRNYYFCFYSGFVIAALCNRGAIIFLPCSFYLLLSIFLFFIPRLISAAADWMSTILLSFFHMAWP